jgi:hypothetical protein
MLFAVLDFGDFAIIALLIAVIAGGRVAASAYLRPADRDQFQRIEHKLDLILNKLDLVLIHLGIEYVPPPKAAWQELADAARKTEAIKVYREHKGVGWAEATEAVEAYIEGKSANP